LPITKAAYEKTKATGFYEKNPVLETPLKELTNKEPTENSRGLRFGNMVQMREVWAEEIEAALAGQKTAKEALDTAVMRGNVIKAPSPFGEGVRGTGRNLLKPRFLKET
jgi:sn-glycerol 3-phosphate transport system substrate-binding protein